MSWTGVCFLVRQWVIVFPGQFPIVTLFQFLTESEIYLFTGLVNMTTQVGLNWTFLLTIAGKCCRLQLSDGEGSQWVSEVLCTSLFRDHLLASKPKKLLFFFFTRISGIFCWFTNSQANKKSNVASHLFFFSVGLLTIFWAYQIFQKYETIPNIV